MLTATRYHDISVGHRVFEQGGKCKHLHGHNYRIHFTLTADEASNDMVMDFSTIKRLFCAWLENHWDHKFLIYEKDPWAVTLLLIDPSGVKKVGFNPTAENMAKFLVVELAPALLKKYENVRIKKVVIEETRKCSAAFEA